jgi:hypothetical protein
MDGTDDLIIASIFIIIINVGMILILRSGSKKKQKGEIQMEVNAAVS